MRVLGHTVAFIRMCVFFAAYSSYQFSLHPFPLVSLCLYLLFCLSIFLGIACPQSPVNPTCFVHLCQTLFLVLVDEMVGIKFALVGYIDQFASALPSGGLGERSSLRRHGHEERNSLLVLQP